MGGIDFIQEEKQLSLKLCSILVQDFDIIQENEIKKSPGKFYLDGKAHNSIPDLLIKPKPHLIANNNFIDTIIPIEIKKFSTLETNKFEDLMFQCHSYRFSTFNGLYPKLCLFFIDNYFEIRESHDHLKYNYEVAKNPKTIDSQIKGYINGKSRIENLFGRFGIGEIITYDDSYLFRLKRQILFERKLDKITFKSKVLNFWFGSSSNLKK